MDQNKILENAVILTNITYTVVILPKDKLTQQFVALVVSMKIGR